MCFYYYCVFFFFQAEDGIRDHCVTGVQTCALPICRLAKIAMLHLQGIKLAIATNQGGVAFGYLDPLEIRRELVAMANEGHIAYVEMCFSHPEATRPGYRDNSPRRKPGPGMLNEIIEASSEAKQDTLMVGDRPEDEQAAQNAGVAFMWGDEFFGC